VFSFFVPYKRRLSPQRSAGAESLRLPAQDFCENLTGLVYWKLHSLSTLAETLSAMLVADFATAGAPKSAR